MVVRMGTFRRFRWSQSVFLGNIRTVVLGWTMREICLVWDQSRGKWLWRAVHLLHMGRSTNRTH